MAKINTYRVTGSNTFLMEAQPSYIWVNFSSVVSGMPLLPVSKDSQLIESTPQYIQAVHEWTLVSCNLNLKTYYMLRISCWIALRTLYRDTITRESWRRWPFRDFCLFFRHASVNGAEPGQKDKASSFPSTERCNTESCEKRFKIKASEPSSCASCGGQHGGRKAWEATRAGPVQFAFRPSARHKSSLQFPFCSLLIALPSAVVSPVCQIPMIYPKIFSSFCTYYLQVIMHHGVIHHGINNLTHGINRT